MNSRNNITSKLKTFISISCILGIILYGCEENNINDEIQADNIWLSPTDSVNGSRSEINNLNIIKLWGSNNEQGFAYGYLLGPDIVDLMNNCMVEMNISPSVWNNAIAQNLDKFNIPDEYDREIQGIFEGLKARTSNNTVYIRELERDLTKDDLSALNCDLLRISCSSFSAWGEMTSDGRTITGRNMDYNNLPSFFNSQIIVVRIPENGSNKKAWLSINWPGDLGCTTGMNEDGLTVSQQDVYTYPPAVQNGFTPDNYIHRLIIENVQINNVAQDISTILQNNYSYLGCAPLVSWPHSNGNKAALVPEFDGNTSDNNGYEIRYPNTNNNFIIGTNHFRERNLPMDDCWRYNILESRMEAISHNQSTKLDVNLCCEILTETPIPELLCMHSVVFEPNKKLIHIAFTNGVDHAPNCQFITLNIEELVHLE